MVHVIYSFENHKSKGGYDHKVVYSLGKQLQQMILSRTGSLAETCINNTCIKAWLTCILCINAEGMHAPPTYSSDTRVFTAGVQYDWEAG